MSLVMFLLGLAVGIGLCLWQQFRLRQRLQRLLVEFYTNPPDDDLSLWSKLRRGVVRDKHHRQQLAEALKMWQQILQSAPLAYLQVDKENQLCWCNQQARTLLKIDHWNPDDSRLLLKLVRSYELDRLLDLTRERQHPCEQEWVFHPVSSDVEKPQAQKSLTLRSHTLPLSDGQVGVFLENRQPEIELAQSQERWLSDLTHELKTPLTSIRLVAETLQSRVDPSIQSWVHRLLRENNRLIQLVQDWLELGQIETNPSRALTCKSLELESLVRSVWQTLEPLANSKQIHLAYSATEPICLEADRSRLYRVFLNLLDNSIQYSPPKAAIQVAARKSSDRVWIDAIDAGSGFAEADRPHVFERLYRGDPSRRRTSTQSEASESLLTSGSGLGLAIVRQIVLAHGGSVTAQNHPETGGAWIQIELPVNCAND